LVYRFPYPSKIARNILPPRSADFLLEGVVHILRPRTIKEAEIFHGLYALNFGQFVERWRMPECERIHFQISGSRFKSRLPAKGFKPINRGLFQSGFGQTVHRFLRAWILF
jgi:hypothetical protein